MSVQRQQAGFTLVEIMVAVAIGLFLTAGVVQMYVSNKQTYRFNEALARMQESGRYALDILGSDLRMAGFWGCAAPGDITDNLAGTPFDPLDGISGGDNVGPIAGADSIAIRGATNQGLRLAGVMTGTNGPVVLEAPAAGGCVEGICDDLIVLVADCERGDIFRVTGDPVGADAALAHAAATGTAPQNSTANLSEVYDEAASVYVIREACYDVALSNGQPSLRRDDDCAGALVPQPLVEGVADMQIDYGVDVPGAGNITANRYVPASGVVDWDNVVSVRVSLLLRSTEDGLTDSQQLVSFNGGTFNAPDRRLYQVMTATYTLRNRVQ